MRADEASRLSLVRQLLELSKPMDELISALATFCWDYEGPNVHLTREHLLGALEKFLEGTLTADDIEVWANSIEGRDDVDFDENNEELVGEILHELANPLLTYMLDEDRAKQLVEKLGGIGAASQHELMRG
ncbi:hypothetical protein [Massilia oculi]|uniref:hypothetical protein n=1 Tax=Massilia oculi TaxID=945844 RepID=UPI001AAEAED7|nr:hypothetical protein [Massilia oculi]